VLATYFIQFAYNFSVVGPVMFVPLLAEQSGANPALVGVIVSVYQVMLFLSSAVFGRLADLKGHKLLIVIGLLLAAGVFLAHVWITSIPTLFLIRALGGLAVGIFPAAIVAYATRGEHNLGRFTSMGSLGWAIGSVVAGFLAIFSRVLLVAAAMYFIAFVVALLGLRETHERVKQPFFDVTVLKRNWRAYLSFFLRHAGAMGIWAIYPIYLERMGANKLWIGLIYAINSFGQFIFMPMLNRYRSGRLIQIGLYTSILTFISFALCRNYKQLLPFQVLLAFAWSSLYVGSLKYLIERNPERSTAVGVLNSTLSMSGIIGAAVGGALANVGLPVVMFGAAAMSVAGAAVFRFGSDDAPQTPKSIDTNPS
jgi:MFS family permease